MQREEEGERERCTQGESDGRREAERERDACRKSERDVYRQMY
jgi:hypothetical protein